jgi:serine phosphatase RsbU (regulator of sigma subunit)
MARIIGTQGLLAGTTIEVGKRAVFGRTINADVRLDEPMVSRVHACIQRAPDGYVIDDLGSGNGTYVNGRRIAAATPLRDGDTMKIGQNVFRFHDPQTPAAAGTGTAVAIQDDPGARRTIVNALPVASAAVDGGAAAQPGVVPAAVLAAHRRLETIVKVSNAVLTELNMDRLLLRILASLLDTFPQAQRGFIMLKEEGGEELTPRAHLSRGGDDSGMSISRTIIQEVATRRVAVLSDDAMDDGRFERALSIVGLGIRSMMCAPLIAHDELLGLIHLDTTSLTERFESKDLELLVGVSNQTSLAVASARMHERLLRQDRMERDLKLANQVQLSFLPAELPDVPGMRFAAYYRAALEVGGDFYDVLTPAAGRVVVVVGDVAGKGVSAALLMGRLASQIRYLLTQEADVSAVLGRLNDEMTRNPMGDMFATVLLVSIDPATGETALGNAGHCRPMIRRAATGEVEEIAPPANFPVGVVPAVEFEPMAMRLEAGDVMFAFSDGVSEAMGADGRPYGEEALRDAIASADPTAEGVLKAVTEGVERHAAGVSPSDDLTCVSFAAVPASRPS